MSLTLTIDDREITVPDGATVWQAAHQLGIEIPSLCHDPDLEPAGVCRLCCVEIAGSKTLAASCVRRAEQGMVVHTASPRVEASRRMLLELLAADLPENSSDPPAEPAAAAGRELAALLRRHDIRPRLPAGPARGVDESSHAIRVDHSACILCDRCIRACRDVQCNDVIARSGKGAATRIGFDLDRPLGQSSCVACGECVAACPTGALASKPAWPEHPPSQAIETVDSICPYCGVGCALTYGVDRAQGRIVWAAGRTGPGNAGRLCVKGRYGYDYAGHAHRLTRPLIRIDYPKGPLSTEVRSSRRDRLDRGALVDPREVMPAFREASWEEALDLTADRLTSIRDAHGPRALAGFGSAKCSNEEAYLFQKLVRTAFGTNNVDHCTRLCHASSVAALMQMIGSGAVTTTCRDVANADFALVTGSNTTANHPVAATFIKNAVRRGTRLLVVDPRHSEIADCAWRFCRIRPGSDVAFYNAMMHVIIEEELVDTRFVSQRTTDFDVVREVVARYPPELASGICGVPARTIREVAIEYGRARAAITFWGMGMSQHVHGTDNCRCLISLCLMTGNVGRPGTGLHPLRGQNNVQGASDAGLVPMFFPGYRPVDDAQARGEFETAWDAKLDPEPGLTVTEILKGAASGDIRGLYMLGENPFLSDPNANEVRAGLSRLDFLVVQDIFLTETAEFADVVLPASSALEKLGSFTNTDRRVQIGRPALGPPGEARLDWEIICEISTRMGRPMHYASPSQIFDEFVSLTPAYKGLHYDALGLTGKLYPCPDPASSDGTVVMFGERFPTASGRARFAAAEHTGADELPDREYPFVLVTGRLLEHWHTGVMTRRSRTLASLEPGPFAQMHREDCERLGLRDGQLVHVSSRRGRISLEVREGTIAQLGSVFIPFHFREASANILTNDALDPDGKIPELKYCAVKVEAA